MFSPIQVTRLALACAATIALAVVAPAAPSEEKREINARKAPVLRVDGLAFKDLNKSGSLDSYEDWRLPVAARVADLISRMTVAEKAGLMMHASIMGFTGPNGVVLDAPMPAPNAPQVNARVPGMSPGERPSPARLINQLHVRWILTRAADPAEIMARWSNNVQEMAEASRLGIPVVISSDPRHSGRRPGAGPAPAQPLISTWPDPLGLGAIGDPDVVRQFGRIAAKEYRALGLQVTLAPMADVATEPRWNRINGTFGDDAALNARMVKAFVEGFQGRELGPESVMCVTKHWPGDGPVKDGLDPHNDYGKWQVYPGGKFDYHLGPFQAAIEAGTGGMMGAYAIPVGFDTVGVNFSKRMITDLLRKKYHFDGYIVTDWNRSMPWGVENLSQKERERMMIEAGIDQLGGEHDPSLLMELIEAGQVSKARIDESVARILRPMFQLGLFENPYLDPERSRTIVASKEFVNAGEAAQRRSVVLLKNTGGTLPVQGKPRIYLEGFGKSAADPYGTAAEDVKSADVAVIKVNAPFAFHPGGGGFFARVHEGTLAYAGAENAKELEAIEQLAASGKPVVVCMYMDRPAVLSEFIERVPAVLAHFGSSDSALLDVVFGRFKPSGKLPFDLPRDMKSVEKQMPDVAHDLENPLFRFGYGLTY